MESAAGELWPEEEQQMVSSTQGFCTTFSLEFLHWPDFLPIAKQLWPALWSSAGQAGHHYSSPQSSFVPFPKQKMLGKEGGNLCWGLQAEKHKNIVRSIYLYGWIFSVTWDWLHQKNLVCALKRGFDSSLMLKVRNCRFSPPLYRRIKWIYLVLYGESQSELKGRKEFLGELLMTELVDSSSSSHYYYYQQQPQ